MPTTQQLRDAWSPVCQVTHRKFVIEAYQVLDNIFKKWNYAPRAGVTGSYNCRQITGGSNYSLHAYRFDTTFTFWTGTKVTIAVAVDVNSDKNPYGSTLKTDMPRGMIEEICAVRTNDGHQVWGWGGYYSGNKDAMHFELNCYPAQLATGIKNYSNNTTPEPIPTVPEDEEDMKRYYQIRDENNISKPHPTKGGGIWVTDGVYTHVYSGDAWVHTNGLGWNKSAPVELIPESLHNWLVANTNGRNDGE